MQITYNLREVGALPEDTSREGWAVKVTEKWKVGRRYLGCLGGDQTNQAVLVLIALLAAPRAPNFGSAHGSCLVLIWFWGVHKFAHFWLKKQNTLKKALSKGAPKIAMFGTFRRVFFWDTGRPARLQLIFLKNSTNLIRIGQLWIWGGPWFAPPRVTLGRWNMDNLSGLGLKLHFVAHGRPKLETVMKFSIIFCTF